MFCCGFKWLSSWEIWSVNFWSSVPDIKYWYRLKEEIVLWNSYLTSEKDSILIFLLFWILCWVPSEILWRWRLLYGELFNLPMENIWNFMTILFLLILLSFEELGFFHHWHHQHKILQSVSLCLFFLLSCFSISFFFSLCFCF